MYRKNVNCSIMEGLERCKEIMDAAKKANIRVRGYAVVCESFFVLLGCIIALASKAACC